VLREAGIPPPSRSGRDLRTQRRVRVARCRHCNPPETRRRRAEPRNRVTAGVCSFRLRTPAKITGTASKHRNNPDLSRLCVIVGRRSVIRSGQPIRCVIAQHVDAEQHHRETENRETVFIDFAGGAGTLRCHRLKTPSGCELCWALKGCAAAAAIDRHRAA
jgi:NMD protein affecting ribosome stability and mRNA decay